MSSLSGLSSHLVSSGGHQLRAVIANSIALSSFGGFCKISCKNTPVYLLLHFGSLLHMMTPRKINSLFGHTTKSGCGLLFNFQCTFSHSNYFAVFRWLAGPPNIKMELYLSIMYGLYLVVWNCLSPNNHPLLQQRWNISCNNCIILVKIVAARALNGQCEPGWPGITPAKSA